jgi:pyruvate dehydrogenase E2 component (dihydrolipoamide acetyltransferase)
MSTEQATRGPVADGLFAVELPKLNDSMNEGLIAGWLVDDGEVVEVGQPIAEIELEKATVELPAPAAGRISLVATVGDLVQVGAALAQIAPSAVPGASPPRTEEPAASSAVGEPAERLRRPIVSPLARRAAAKLGVDLADVKTAEDRITVADVERLAAAREPADTMEDGPTGSSGGKGEIVVEPLTPLQSIVARRMMEAKATAPEFVLHRNVDMDAALELRSLIREDAAPNSLIPSINDFIVKATALALRRVPRANGSFSDAGFQLYSRVNIGIAVATKDGLIVPTITDADLRTVGDIARVSRELAERARDGKSSPEDLENGTFTISNLGMHGITSFVPIINPPQAAILGVGAIERIAAPNQEDEVSIRRQMGLTLACDHRIVYGVDGARLLDEVCGYLERPSQLLL